VRGLAVLFAVGACGRIGFDPVGGGGGGGDAGGDGSASVMLAPCAFASPDSSPTIESFATDDQANAYLVLGLTGRITIGGQMFANADFRDLIAVSLDASCTVRWVHRFVITYTQGGIIVTGRPTVLPDGSGGAFVAADFIGTIDPGDGARTAAGGTTDKDLFVAHLDATGALAWFHTLGGTGPETVGGLAAVPSGLVVAGSFTTTIDLGAGNVSSAGMEDIFFVGYALDGTMELGKPFGGAGDDYVSRIAADAAGTIYAAGSITGTTNLGTGTLTSAGSYDAWGARYSSGFAPQMAARFGGTGIEFAFIPAVDASSNLTIAGYFESPTDFGFGTVTPVGMSDVFVIGLATSGSARWAREFGGTDLDLCEGLAIDGDGDVVAAGTFGGTVDFGEGPVTTTNKQGFVVALASDGTTRWVATLPASGVVDAHLVAPLPGSGVAVAGLFTGTMQIGGTMLDAGQFEAVFVAQVH
jgi:hypothetical protein